MLPGYNIVRKTFKCFVSKNPQGMKLSREAVTGPQGMNDLGQGEAV